MISLSGWGDGAGVLGGIGLAVAGGQGKLRRGLGAGRPSHGGECRATARRRAAAFFWQSRPIPGLLPTCTPKRRIHVQNGSWGRSVGTACCARRGSQTGTPKSSLGWSTRRGKAAGAGACGMACTHIPRRPHHAAAPGTRAAAPQHGPARSSAHGPKPAPGETRPPPMHAGPFPGSSLRKPHTLARSPALLLGVIQAALDKLGGTTAEDQAQVLRAALGAVKGLPDMTPALQARKQGFLFVDGEVVEGPGACSRLHGRQRCSPGIRPSPRIAVGPPRRRCTPGLCPLEAAWKLAAPRGPPCWSSLRPRRGAARRWQRPGSGRW